MKTMRAGLGCGVGVLLWCACLCEGAPSLTVTKPPVQLPTLMTGPPIDPTATFGQWFVDTNGVETVRTNEFYDETAGGLGANAITGFVDNIVYQGGPGTPIQGFSIQATIHNDTTVEAGWAPGSNSHGESRPRVEEQAYVGPLIDVKLAAEFAIGDSSKLPLAFNYPAGPYREGGSPFIEAIDEDQWAWYCWNPEDPDLEHQPPGGYFVPTWDFGTIPQGQSATRQLQFVVAPPGLQPADPRYVAIVASSTALSDILLNRSQSLKISTWIDDIALDQGSGMEEPPPLRLSDVSVFHNPYQEEEEQLDFGDAPDPTYPTLLASDGARHVVNPSVFMGAQIDAETDGQPNAGATGDDMANLADEDGVVLPPQLYVGVVSTASVVVSTSGYLTAWIDYNANGSWELGERVFGAMVVTAGVNNLVFTVPSGTPTGATYARFRYTTQMGALLPTGAAPDGEVEDYQVTILQEEEEELDFGDAPDSSVSPLYPTLLVNNGARHVVVPGLYLGTLIDSELDGQPDPFATGDDLANLADEDGVTFLGPLIIGQTATVQVTVVASGPCSLSGWIDFNIDGSWAGNQMLNATVPGSGTYQYPFLVPGGASPGTTFARFRLTTQVGPLSEYGLAPDGEVEDYQMTIAQEEENFDFGDAPDPAYPTLLANNGARHVVPSAYWLGAIAPDAEPDGIQDPQALGDDNHNVDDEDLVAVHAFLVQGSNAMVDVVASSNGYFNAWVDHNQNGSWADSGEQVMTNYVLVPGSNQVPWLTPSNALLGTTFCRVRFCSYAGLSVTGSASDGEVEDYEVTILSPEGDLLDFGDADDPAYPTLRTSTGACHTVVAGVYLGATIDAEPDGQPDGTATGDDNNPPLTMDDEDGVTLPATLYAGSTAPVHVVASVPGFLNAWIDWNGNGNWGDAGEQVFVNHPLIPGPNPLLVPVPVPPALNAGGPQSRWRFTTSPMIVPGPGYQGLWPDGEVEDYEVRLESLDFGDAPDGPYPTLLASDGARHRTPSAYWLGGVAPDTEPEGLADAHALGDDHGNIDDEDWVAVAATLVRGSNKTVAAYASGSGYLNLWVDFNADGDWADAGEQAVADLALVPGLNPVTIPTPSGATVGPTFGRMRFCSYAGLGYVGLATDGEVEDHQITIYQNAPDTNAFWITNVAHTATNEITIEWMGDTNAIYETQYILDLPSTASPPWTAWGAWVSAPPLLQRDTNAAGTAKHYRVVAPFSPPPP